ncbi:MAG: restriction endonuclease subunit S [Cyanobacteria bacterium SBLK]|nr:restriction endonuclease subunit S [Cyanobacteria bacterium SBLK]
MIEERSNLPKGWRLLPINETANINPSTLLPENITDSSNVLHFSMASIDELNGILKEPEFLSFKKCRSGKSRFIDNDVLFAKITPCMQNKKSALVEGLKNNIGFGSSEFYVLRSKKIISPQYLFFFVRQNSFIEEATKNFTGTSGRQRVPSSFWQNINIPLPPLPVQERIVEILQKADEIRRKRQEALAIADSILPAIFNDMFGNQKEESKKFTTVKLKDICTITSGKTPSKKNPEFWTDGIIPWISAKNMKVLEIYDVPDKITEKALGSTKKTDIDTILIVVRGMILQHSVPICLVKTPLTFNQDIKGLKPKNNIPSEFIFWSLKYYERKLLELVDTASHGTQKIDTDRLMDFTISLVDFQEMQYFSSIHRHFLDSEEKRLQAKKEAEDIFNSLLSQAFTGELTAEWEQIHAEYIANQQQYYQRLPQLTLLFFLQKRQKTILVTELMKYVFLLQMEGSTQQRYYQFIPYHYGPFAEDIYRDLETLQQQGAIAIDKRDKEKTKISLSDAKTIPQTLSQLPADLQEDIATILNQYGDLNLTELLDTVYQKYPTYAKNSKRKRSTKKEAK